jgi:hydrogenase expression/formation protein HypE
MGLANAAKPVIQLGHGGGGRLSQRLIQELLVPAFGPHDGLLHDAALLAPIEGLLAFTTDSYVVHPLIFPGGDIGRLAVIGSVNDLAMAGAIPVALSLGLILEEGLPMAVLETVVASIQTAAAECGVAVVTGDTKVVERGKGDGLFINTSAVGQVAPGLKINPLAIREGDAVLVSGDLGRHGIAILAARGQLGFQAPLMSDLAPLLEPVQALLADGLNVHCLRDLTRGGLAGAIDEIARSGGHWIELEEGAIPVAPSVQGACDLLGFDPIALANEGRMLVILPAGEAPAALALLRAFEPNATRIGTVSQPFGAIGTPWGGDRRGQPRNPVSLYSALGVKRPLEVGLGELLPRIC